MARASPDPDFLLRENKVPVTCFCYSSEKNLLLNGNQNGGLKVWNLSTRRVITDELVSSDEDPVSAILQIDGRLLVQTRQKILIYDWDDSKLILKGSFSYYGMSFCGALLHSFENKTCLFLPGEGHSTLDIWNLGQQKIDCSLSATVEGQHCGMCMCACLVDRSDRILVGYENGCIVLWSLDTKKQLSSCSNHKEVVLCLDFHESNNIGISGSTDNSIILWKVADNSDIKKVNEITITNAGVNCVKIRDDGKIFATGGWDSNIRIFSCKTHKQLAVLSSHRDSIQCIKFLPDSTLVAGSKDSIISVWSIYKNN